MFGGFGPTFGHNGLLPPLLWLLNTDHIATTKGGWTSNLTNNTVIDLLASIHCKYHDIYSYMHPLQYVNLL